MLPVVMITKSEEDATLREALGAAVHDYLVKPVNPRQVLTAITRILDGTRLRQQALAREFVERFRALGDRGVQQRLARLGRAHGRAHPVGRVAG